MNYPEAIGNALKKLDDLVELQTWYFTQNKQEKRVKIESLVAKISNQLDSLSPEQIDSHRALIYYLKGQSLNANLEYSEESEKLLTKSVKLCPNNTDAWNALGSCLWKKGEIIYVREGGKKNHPSTTHYAQHIKK